MGKVRDESPPMAPKPAAKSAGSKSAPRGQVASLIGNLLTNRLYKPSQGRQARLWSAVGLGVMILSGLYSLYTYQLADSTPLVAYGIPALLGVIGAWITWRVVQYPPFVDFLVATEAEMNKVSWTTKDDLYRATIVVLVTVVVLSLYLFGVDMVWSGLLRMLGVLRFEGMTPVE